MKKNFRRWAVTGWVLIFSSACSCSHLFYQPSREVLSDPTRGNIDYEEVTFQAQDGVKLYGWFFKAKLAGDKLKIESDSEVELESERQGIVIQFHGNAQNMTSHFLNVYWLTYAGYDVFSFDYRGYGLSEGEASQEGLNRDAFAAIKYILNRQPTHKSEHGKRTVPDPPKKDIVLYGQSLGGAVLARAYADVVDRERIKAVIIEGSFYSYKAVARASLARSWVTFLFQPLAYFLVSDAYSPEPAIPKIAPTPLLVVHGNSDTVVPFFLGKKIGELASEPKEFWEIKNGKHIDAMHREKGRYREKLIEYLKRLP